MIRATPKPAARHGQQATPHPALFVVKSLALVLAVVLVSGASVGAIATWQVFQEAQPTVDLVAPPGKSVAPPPALTAQSGAVNMLLVSTDTRTGQGAMFADPADQKASTGVGNNDVNLLLHIAADHKSMQVVSFPRDLVIPIPDCPNDQGGLTPGSQAAMINTAISRGGEKRGISCAAATVSKLTGLQIDYAAKITFLGTIAMSDAIGGVHVCLATDVVDNMVTPALDLKAGTQTLVGAQAMAFLRSRHGVGDASDLGRVSNQQTFMSAMMRQIVSGGTLGDPAKLYRLATAMAKNVQLSSSLSPTTLAKIGLAVKSVGISNITFLSYPVIDDPSDSAHVIPDPGPAAILDKALVSNQAVKLSPNSLGRAAVLAPGSGASTPATPSAPATAGGSSTGTPTTGTPTGTPVSPSGPAVLPDSVTGQNADQVTCAKKG
ncbi:hypothetical protein GCM10025867_02000 [Frondihabitans sucicola]|uniref:Cell envelope-related transcriptional attenuator domain-containing protein n=1 Tax=Frondihabitans sucicola TaxID=1268041 RepID=A0ABN6XSJ6_9MICO|nr:LCP family protein [Frondihabitans sucicola]BDZ47959.1 hypothetical protein GCM10025867_02000 [Frondihabitans sucicola]